MRLASSIVTVYNEDDMEEKVIIHISADYAILDYLPFPFKGVVGHTVIQLSEIGSVCNVLNLLDFRETQRNDETIELRRP